MKTYSLDPSGKPLRHRCTRRLGARRRGNVVVLTALIMVALFAMLAFALDIGYMLHVRTELQRSADACAIAAAPHLPDEAAAGQAALQVAAQNPSGTEMILDISDTQFGYWDRDTATFTTPTPSGRQANAVRVTVKRTDETGNPVSMFFAGMLGTPTANVTATATALYDRGLCGPLIGIEWVDVPGTPQTASYNAAEDPLATSLGDRGGVCSDGPILVAGDATVRGDVRAGKGFDVTIEGNPTITGSIGSRLKPLNLPPVDDSEAAAENDNDQLPLIKKGKSWISPLDGSGNFVLDGNKEYDIPPGTYYFNDFTLSGQCILNVSGPTIVYITGNLERAGGTTVNNNTLVPSNLQFYMTGGTANITSNNNFYGVIYAPNTDINLDGAADLYGVVVGKTLTMTGSGQAFYDESLDLIDVELSTRTALVD